MNRWLLPEQIADILPAQARKIEDLRRGMLDRARAYGYELVMPPMLEYLDSLITGTGQDLNLKTFKLVDQLSGRTLGLRADITPQVARIDAHILNRDGITRLCYAGPVLHTKASPGNASREQLQFGAEIYGYPAWEADLEVQRLLNELLGWAQVGSVTFDLGHADILPSLLQGQSLTVDELEAIYESLQSKDISALQLAIAKLPKEVAQAILALNELSGEAKSVLAEAKKRLPQRCVAALDELLRMSEALGSLSDAPQVNIDLADMRGYQYHSGVMFACYVAGSPSAIARGGRYDHVGQAFGRSRPATGFSLDIITLASLSKLNSKKNAIQAPLSGDQTLQDAIQKLRVAGEIVIQMAPDSLVDAEEFVCDRTLVLEKGAWVVRPRA